MSQVIRRLVQESIEIVSHDVQMSYEIPQSGGDVEMGLHELDINKEVEEINDLFERSNNYHQLMQDFTNSSGDKILSASEEKFFTTVANMGLAGTGLTVKDLELVAKKDYGYRVSTEGLEGVIKSIGHAIASAIRWIIQKIVSFWNWLTGSGGKNEEKKDRDTVEDIKKIPEPLMASLDTVIEKVAEAGMGNPNSVVDLGGGIVIHGDTLMFTNKRPGQGNGETISVNLRGFTHIRWSEINLMFPEPPDSKFIDVTRIPNYLKVYLDKVATLAPVMAKLNEMGVKVSEAVRNSKSINGPTGIETAKGNILKFASEWEAFVKSLNPVMGETVDGKGGVTYLPNGTRLARETISDSFDPRSPWVGSLNEVHRVFCAVYKNPEAAGDHTDKTWYLKFGGSPSAIANGYDAFIKAYLDAFSKIAPAQDENKLRRQLDNVAAVAHEAESSGYREREATYEEFYVRDLFIFQSLISRSQAGILKLLTETIKMVAQHRSLHHSLRKLAVRNNRSKK